MKFLVIGCGSIGERHINNLKNLSIDKILTCDINLKRLQLIKEKYDIEIYKNINDAFNQCPDAVLICTPPTSHIHIARSAIDNNSHVFIEKPISHNLKGIDEFLIEAKKKNLVVSIGYMLRFHPGIQLIKNIIDNGEIGRILHIRAEFGQYLPDWRPCQDYRKSYSSQKNLGGGIILDSSHEIDYISWIINSDIEEIFCFANKISDLDVDVEDVSDILFKSKNNIVGEIHLDFIQRCHSRNCKIICENGTLIWDNEFVKIYYSSSKKWKTIQTKIEVNYIYVKEMMHFINCINGISKPIVDGDAAKKILEIVIAAKKSAKTGKVIKLQR